MCESQVKCRDREDGHDSGRLMGAPGRRWRCHRARGATSAKHRADLTASWSLSQRTIGEEQ